MKETIPKQNIYSKVDFVNCLTDKEISRLNNKYLHYGLQMKQIKVDKFGNEISKKQKILGKKRERKEYNSLDKFLFGYYGQEEFYLLNQNFEKEEKKLFDFDPEDRICTRKCLSHLKDSLNEIKIDCEYMANKNSKIETDEYKSVVLKFIAKFRKYITKDQYEFLYNKWKNELLKVRGTDLFNLDKINNIINWKVSILKCFKSEIVLYGICNIYDGIIAGNKFVIETKPKLEEENDIREEEKVYESEDNEQSSDSELSEKTFEGNMINS